MTTNTINETEFQDYLQNGVVKRLNLVQVDSGRFHVMVQLSWKEGDFYLVSARKQKREWASLDRLTRYIREKASKPIVLNISLN